MDRQADRGCFWGFNRYGGARAQTLLRGGAGSRVDAQKAREAKKESARWQGRGTLGRFGLLRSTPRARALEYEASGRSDGGARSRAIGLIRDRQAHTQKNKLKPHLKRQWVIPPRKSAAFVWRMEGVLDLYEQPYDSLLPMVCFDERPCQLIGEVKDPLPVKPGQVGKIDSHYERRGICHVLLAFEPLGGWREVEVTERRRGREFAHSMRRLELVSKQLHWRSA